MVQWLKQTFATRLNLKGEFEELELWHWILMGILNF